MFLSSHRNKRNLFGSLRLQVGILLQSRSRGKPVLKELSIEIVHAIRVLNLPQINCGKYDIGKTQVSFLQAVQKIAHGLPKLQLEIGCHDSLVWNEAIFGGKIKGVAIENAGTCSWTRRHIFGTDSLAFSQISAGNATENHMMVIRKTHDLNRSPPRRISELKIR